jgi:hypothetical protein
MNVECLLTAGQLRAKFVRRGDRIAHTIELEVGDETVALLESCEGSVVEHWPASPPVQELERGPGASASPSLDAATPQVAWLIGRAGASHWSASVEAHADGSILFDVACRLREAPTWLGSRYRVLDSVTSSGLAVETLDGCQFATEQNEQGNAAISFAADLPTEGFPLTVRWRYRLSWQG